MKILLGGFRGNTNSSQIIIDKITSKHSIEKLYLINSFEGSKNQLVNLLDKQVYDLIVMFGQKQKVNSLYLECQADMKGHKLLTNYKYDRLARILTDGAIAYQVSHNAGNYLCNHIFYNGLKYIQENNLKTEMIFIHVPSVKNIDCIDNLACVLSAYLDQTVDADI